MSENQKNRTFRFFQHYGNFGENRHNSPVNVTIDSISNIMKLYILLNRFILADLLPDTHLALVVIPCLDFL